MNCLNPECGRKLYPRTKHKTLYCPGRYCRQRHYEILHRHDRNDRKRDEYEAEKYKFSTRGVKLELIEDPSDSWIVGNRFGSGQIRHDMAVNASIWMPGTKFQTENGVIVEIRQCNLWANGREWRGDLK